MNERRWGIRTLRFLALLLLTAFALLPFYVMVKSSFEPYASIVSVQLKLVPDTLYTDNYAQLFTKHPVLRWAWNSIFVSVVVIAGNLVFDTAAAYALSRLQFPGRKLLFLAVLATLIVPIQVILVPLYMMMTTLRWLNTYWALIVPMLISPFGIFLLRQNFMNLPKEMDEAALIDGTSRLGILWRIVVPNSLPALGTLTVIKFMWVWGDYLWPALVAQKEAMRTLPVGIASFQYPGGTMAWDLVMAGAVIAVVPIVLMFLYLQKYFVQGLTEGAVKG